MNFSDQDLVDGGASPKVRVRGLRAPQATPVHHCRHCGTPLVTGRTRESGFCCTGCAYVHRLVHEHGLEGYYRIRDTAVAPVDQVVFHPRDYAWLAELQAEAEGGAAVVTPEAGATRPARLHRAPELTLEVQGISCAGCVWLIEKVFHQQKGSLGIETDAQLGRMRLRWVRGEFDAPAFARALQSFNYLVGPPGEEPPVPESRRLVRRVGLCAAFAMNIMLFALPAYFGMEATFPYAHLFSTLAMGFATLSLLTGGSYFLGRAWQALRSGVLHIDLPIAVGIVGSYAGSFYGWVAGREEYVYFDFVGTFILLMLVGRWAQVAAVERNRRRLLSVQGRPHKVRVLGSSGAAVEQPVENLRPGDVFRVRSGQVVPVEAQLDSSSASFGTAWVTGEADPREYRQGGRVPAGAVSLARGEVQLRATQGWSDSLLAKLLQPAGRDAYRHRLLERIVGGYLVAIFAAALIGGAVWWLGTRDPVQTFAVVTAVLVVSCPCAVGLSFPLADEMATVALRRHGVFVRETDLWPRLGRIRRLIFDKTGTLTLETPVLRNPGSLEALGLHARAALLTLVRDNPHPVSQSLLENLLASGRAGRADRPAEPARPEDPSVVESTGTIQEEPGFGVRWETPTGVWSLGRPGWAGSKAGSPSPAFGIASASSAGVSRFDDPNPPSQSGGHPASPGGAHDTEFACDGVVLARFRFADSVRPGAAADIDALRRDGLEIFILSGDHEAKVQAMAAALGLPQGYAVAGATPEQKASWVQMLDRRDTLMLGDGANDSLAFDAAFARGTPVIHRGVLEGKADFYYLGQGLGGLRRLFAVNAARRHTQRALLGFSVVYNAFAVGLAITGHMNPLLAAIIMPVSSLVSLAIVGAGMRRWLL